MSYEAVHVKQEPPGEESAGSRAGLCAADADNMHFEEETDCTEEEVGDVKEEPGWENSTSSCGVSEAAARAGLYADHTVKDELVLGPECLQPPDVAYTLRCDLNPTVRGIRDCSVILERCDGLIKHQRPEDSDWRLKIYNNFECDSCSKTFQKKCSLIRHIRVPCVKPKFPKKTRSVPEKIHSCSTCGGQFSSAAGLRRHARVHAAPAPCALCGAQFTRLRELLKHRRTHVYQRPYSCEICQIKFTTSSNLNQHIRTHTGEKLYSCEICEMKLADSRSVNAHMVIHTDVEEV